MAIQKSSSNVSIHAQEAHDKMLLIVKMRIQELVNTQKMTQYDIAKMCNLEPSQIGRILKGERGERITLLTMIKLYYGLQIQLGSVFLSLDNKKEYDVLKYIMNFYSDEITKIAQLTQEEKDRFHAVIRAHLGLSQVIFSIKSDKNS